MSPGPSISVHSICRGGNTGDRFCTDIRPWEESANDATKPEGYLWRFDVVKNFALAGPADEVLLEASGLASVPPGDQVMLHDLVLSKRIDLREESSYSFFMGTKEWALGEEARFMLLVGDEDYVRSQTGESGLPVLSRLLQNYPNPFRAGSVIRYELAHAGDVRFMIFDVQGRLVKTLEEGHRDPGRYEVAWSGISDRGEPVPPGVYFYRIIAPGFSETRKMIRIN
jgi:hypothetical protein